MLNRLNQLLDDPRFRWQPVIIAANKLVLTASIQLSSLFIDKPQSLFISSEYIFISSAAFCVREAANLLRGAKGRQFVEMGRLDQGSEVRIQRGTVQYGLILLMTLLMY